MAESTQQDRMEAAAFNGTRKLIRPHLPVQDRRRDSGPRTHVEDPLTHAMAEPHIVTESSHAEAFYFQKQMQMQTEMMVVLDDGEELRGVIEWYDKCVVKLRDRAAAGDGLQVRDQVSVQGQRRQPHASVMK